MPSKNEKTPPLTDLLAALAGAGVEFILVGGLAAVAQGAAFNTLDVDVVHRRDDANLDRLLAFLASVHARCRGRKSASLAPSRSALVSKGHSLFETDLGPLDVLDAIEGGRDCEALLPDTLTVRVEGRALRVLGLEAIARFERSSKHPKDRLALQIIDEALGRRGRRRR